ncbi:hypothetical protein AB9P05_24760 [Roseivirga sp. BDSF3-8]|uniref:hypothetical protein n=1 Tax=Roseivirga sp. BDSF3-8 TaxID=3241598 RepID=UPI00353180BB
MIHLITVSGKSARHFYLRPECVSDFKSLVRTITSENPMVISTRFRSDVFYKGDSSCSEAILKMWTLYGGMYNIKTDPSDVFSSDGDQEALERYFHSINALSLNWYYYNQYRKAFSSAYSEDRQNTLAATILQCDEHLTRLPCTRRASLRCDMETTAPGPASKDHFALAMRLLNNQSHIN